MNPAAKVWHLLPHDPDAVRTLTRELATCRLSPLIGQLLLQRGHDRPESARRFLESPLTGLHPPEQLPGVPEAARRLLAAAHQKRRICLYGDYDVDGISGTALLWHLLRLLEAPVEFYVPHRLDEGYGLNCEALAQLAAAGVAVVVTVDCGIASIDEARAAKELGLELIITDHHEPKETLPDAAVLVHPRLAGGSYPFGGLSGAGVALKVAWALCRLVCGSEKVTPLFREYLLDAVGLAALGTIADVVPLLDENRILVRHGLKRLADKPPIGIAALLRETKLTEKSSLLAEDIGYRMAPWMNAVGRLGCARLVVELLTTAAEERATTLARHLQAENLKRQQLERKIQAQAHELVLEALGPDGECGPALVLSSNQWHAGVIGIVAGRLAEHYARPVLLIAEPAEPAQPAAGSGRSVPGFALHQALAACREGLISHGGHAAAAGFKLPVEQISVLRERFRAYAAAHFKDGVPRPRLVIDAEVPLSAVTLGLVKDLARLEPYGAENRRPRFLVGGVRVVGTPKRMGIGERHLSFRVRQEGVEARAVGWSMADRVDELLSAGGVCSLVFSPKINVWNGLTNVDLEIVDFQPGAQARLD